MKASIYRNEHLAGELEKTTDGGYRFQYDTEYAKDSKQPPISLTLPKREEPYLSDTLFPFFFNLLSEGVNRQLQSRFLKIDENDSFTLLINTCRTNTIGAIRVIPENEQ